MNIKQRRILYLSLILLFLALAPILILYARGYSFSFPKKKIVKTGLLSIDSRPTNAEIYLNNAFTKEKTPWKFRYLTAGTYKIEVKKSGYTPWQKHLTVLPGFSTFAEKITLFLTKPLFQQIGEKIKTFKISSEGKLLALISGKENPTLSIVNLIYKNKKVISNLSKDKTGEIFWAGKRILLKIKNNNYYNYHFFHIDYPEEIVLSETANYNFTKIEESGNNLYGLANQGLYKIDLEKKQINQVSVDNILDFIIKDKIYLLKNIPEGIELSKINGETEEKTISLFRKKTAYHFIDPKGPYFIAANEKDFILYKKNGEKIKEFKQRIIGAEISPDKEKLMYFNEGEIWVYSFKDNSEKLILRQKGPIRQVKWYPKNDYLIYQSENSIKATETDLRDQRNEITLFPLDQNYELISALSEKYLVIIKKGAEDTLYLVKIQ